MLAECQPGLHLCVILVVFVVTVAVLSIEVGNYSFQEEEPTFRIHQTTLHLLIVSSLFLYNIPFTSAYVGLTTKICKLQESLLTASQFPSLLKAIE
jgi:hypothetical protein